jgi:endonuclease/exonuclease/phosphatase family metal-dependent hydrolase
MDRLGATSARAGPAFRDLTGPQVSRSLRVATWNLWWRFGPWRQRAEVIRDVLVDVAPDICGLQEVWSDDQRNFASELAEELGMRSVWLRSPEPERWRSRMPGCSAEVGHAILARWPILDPTELPLPPGRSGDRSRNALVCVVESPDGRIPLATTQLTAAPWDSAARCEQVTALVRFLGGREREDYPCIVMGDMNAEPDSDEIRLLCGHKTAPVREGFVLLDAWRYAPIGATPWTWDRANPHVAATMEPSSRIDYILVGPPGAGRRGHVLSTRRIGTRPVRGVWPSDHAGVLAELEMRALDFHGG